MAYIFWMIDVNVVFAGDFFQSMRYDSDYPQAQQSSNCPKSRFHKWLFSFNDNVSHLLAGASESSVFLLDIEWFNSDIFLAARMDGIVV